MLVNDHKKPGSGKVAENFAAEFLESKGCNIVVRNYRYRRSEIDIIYNERGVLVFGEVKFRSNSKFGHAESFVSKNQEEKILDAANNYLLENPWDGPVRFDIISLEGPIDSPSVSIFRDAISGG